MSLLRYNRLNCSPKSEHCTISHTASEPLNTKEGSVDVALRPQRPKALSRHRKKPIAHAVSAITSKYSLREGKRERLGPMACSGRTVCAWRESSCASSSSPSACAGGTRLTVADGLPRSHSAQNIHGHDSRRPADQVPGRKLGLGGSATAAPASAGMPSSASESAFAGAPAGNGRVESADAIEQPCMT